MPYILYILVGLVAGAFGGALGLGGGAIMVPAMIYFFHLTQHQAQGTALAVMMVPVFVLAVMRYYQAGNVNVQMAMFIAMGFAVGALIGAHVIQGVPAPLVKKWFGVFMILLGIKMVFFK